MIHIYTGNGKGKTSVALELAIRGAGHGMKNPASFLYEGRHERRRERA